MFNSSLDEFLFNELASRPSNKIELSEPIELSRVPTPALLLDLNQLMLNQQVMASAANASGLSLRSHAKMHKCPEVAKLQLANGSSGICCAKVSEAQVMQQAGVEEILITSPVQHPSSLAHVAFLARSNPRLMIVVDSKEGALKLNQRLLDEGLCMTVLIDIDPGLGRTGIAADENLLGLIECLETECHQLSFGGIQVYAGHCMHIAEYAARESKYQRAMAHGERAKTLLEDRGVLVPLVSGGGTGSFDLEQRIGLLTELQAGSYAFMDIEYRDIESASGSSFDIFGVALSLLVTAISQPSSRSFTVDAGFKSLASDKMAPEFLSLEGVRYHWGGDEHGIVALDNPSHEVRLGDTLQLITPHCDPTVNLHDHYFIHKAGQVQELWPITARGCSR